MTIGGAQRPLSGDGTHTPTPYTSALRASARCC